MLAIPSTGAVVNADLGKLQRSICAAPPAAEPDPEALLWWLHHLFDRCDPTGWVIASTMASGGDRWRDHVHAFTVGERASAVDKLTDLAGKGDLYLTCCPRAQRPPLGRRGGADTVVALPGFWADIDVYGPRHAATNLPPTDEDARALASDVGKRPSLVLHSGGGLQVWWLFDKPLVIDDDNRAEVAELVEGWGRTMFNAGALKGWHVDKVSDLPRVLRPAGTVNRKSDQNGQPLPPLAVAVGDGPAVPTRYSVSELSTLIVPEKPKPTAPKRSPNHRLPPPPGVPDGPADLLAGVPWSTILHGWEFVRMANISPHGMAEQWLRPGSLNTHSGNFWVRYGVIHSDVVEVRHTGKALSKFQIYADLWHGGNESAAAKTIHSDALTRWGVAR